MRQTWMALAAVLAGALAAAAAPPQAALVMDLRDGTVYHAENAEAPMHPASLTKMMTLYLVFEAIEAGEVAPDTAVSVSQSAADRSGATMALRAGQTVALRDLVTGAALASGNDAATALAEAVAGTEAAFVARMNATAQRLGLTGTVFANPHGLTAEGHRTTARDMARLARHLHFDHPGLFALFARVEAQAGPRRVLNTNRRFLNAYDGADGLKTGYTRASGYSLVASARRGERRLIVVVFGAGSSAERAARAGHLMDRGFALAPAQVPRRPPRGPSVDGFLVSLAPQTPFGGAVGPREGEGGFRAGSVLAQPSTQETHGLTPVTVRAGGTAPPAPGLGGVGTALFGR